MSSNCLIVIKSWMFHYMEDEHFLSISRQPDTVSASFIWPWTKAALKASGKDEMQRSSNASSVACQGNTDSTCSPSRQLFTGDKGGKFLISTMEPPCICPKVFSSRSSSLTLSFPRQGEYPCGWFGSRSQTQSSQAFPSVHAYLGSCSDIYSVCFSRGAACNLGVSSEQVGCQIVLKTCPFHLLSGYCTQMNRGLLSLETFWSTKHSRKSTGGTNSLRHQ